MNRQSDRWLSGFFSSRRLCTMSIHVRPHLGVGICLYLSVTLGLSQGQGEDTGEGSWDCGSHLTPPQAIPAQGTGPLRDKSPSGPEQLLLQGAQVLRGQRQEDGTALPPVSPSAVV